MKEDKLIFKKCSKCNTWKNEREFPVDKRLRCGRRANCKICEKKRHRDYYWANHKEQVQRIKQNHIKNAEKEAIYRKKLWNERRAWCQQNPKKFAEIRRKSRKKTKARENAYNRKRLQSNPQFRLKRRVGTAIWRSLKESKKGKSWENVVGYTLRELQEHLEKQFQPGMNWGNYGQWHIDHIIPVSFFSFTSFNDVEFKKCWALSNLQPMWAKDNQSKGAKIA